MSLKIKNVELPTNVTLAPMAGYTDFAFRQLCEECGAGLTCTEMVSSAALHYKNKKTEDMLVLPEKHGKVAVQLFGHDPQIMAEAATNPLVRGFDIIDINMGCPAKKITSNGDGGALLKNPELARQIIEACAKATDKPITVKFRLGYRDGENIAVKFAQMCEAAGASAIAVHGRTVQAGYSGKVDYDAIAAVKRAVSIPVFANGDIRTLEDKEKVLSLTGADGVMIGRASLGRPEVFAELTGMPQTGVSKLSQLRAHYQSLLQVYPEKYVAKYMRSHLAHYLKFVEGGKAMLPELLKMEKVSDILAKIEKK